jgi:hypothetical protein
MMMMMIGIKAFAGSEIAACGGGGGAKAKEAETETKPTAPGDNGQVAQAKSKVKDADSNMIAEAKAIIEEMGADNVKQPPRPGTGVGTNNLAEVAKALAVIVETAQAGGNAGISTIGAGNNGADVVRNTGGNNLRADGQNAQIQGGGQGKRMQGNGFTIFGQKFVGQQGQTMGQAVHATDGITAKEHTIRGVKAHEDAHRITAQAYGIDTGQSTVTLDGDLATSGHVELRPQLAWDSQRAKTDKNYLAAFKKQATGMVASANAPANSIAQFGSGISGLDANGYGKLSQADIDISNKWKGELAKAEAVG